MNNQIENDYREALLEILYPVAAMRKRLQPDEQLCGSIAIQLASDPSYLKQIAESVLRKHNPELL